MSGLSIVTALSVGAANRPLPMAMRAVAAATIATPSRICVGRIFYWLAQTMRAIHSMSRMASSRSG